MGAGQSVKQQADAGNGASEASDTAIGCLDGAQSFLEGSLKDATLRKDARAIQNLSRALDAVQGKQFSYPQMSQAPTLASAPTLSPLSPGPKRHSISKKSVAEREQAYADLTAPVASFRLRTFTTSTS